MDMLFKGKINTMNKFVLFVLVLLTFSCENEDFEISNLNNNKVTALGHGGMGIGHVYPMNSYESILNCLSLGADGTEIDVQMTRDSVLVAFHDVFLDHSTNVSGRISDKTWSEISSAYYDKLPYANYKLITLDELFSNLPNKEDYIFFFDCKSFHSDKFPSYFTVLNNALVKLINKHNLENNVYLTFKRKESIKSLRPDLKIFVYADFDSAFSIAKEFKLQGITIAVDRISKDEVLKAHNNGFMVAVYNAHSAGRNIDAINKNVDFIQSDRVKHLIKVLK